ncbi:SRPBCC domain-containing protein [Taklimakanibacter lacteus]|uniref:SRPBCC domain-containing protein n=1 Tax=Taklimakanibacter lacteus TaxID=2268456 RepID=UPI000E6710AE
MARKAEAPARELHLSRHFDAPRTLVFALWTDPRHLVHWWGPRGFRTLSCEVDLKPGGSWRIHSRSPDGMKFSSYGEFREIVVPERLVFTHGFEMPGKSPGPLTLVTALFTEADGRTLLTFHQGVFDTIADRNGHEEGWSSAFDLIDEYLRDLA